jgi:hypothetical protein
MSLFNIAVIALAVTALVILVTAVVGTYTIRSLFPLVKTHADDNPGFYRTRAESIPASRQASKDLVDLSHSEVLTVSKNEPERDPSGGFKGYLDFGYTHSASHSFNYGFASGSSSGSHTFSTVIAPNHLYFAEFRRFKVGQKIVFEEIPTNNLPKEELSIYTPDPYLIVRPVAAK